MKKQIICAAFMLLFQFIYTGLAQSEILQESVQKLLTLEEDRYIYYSRSISVDGNTLAVGAIPNQGGKLPLIYVFSRPSSEEPWSLQQRLTINDSNTTDINDIFVSLYGDTLLVGNPGDGSGSKENTGSACVFIRSGNVWTQQQEITAPDGDARDGFGTSVSLHGDTAVIGASGDDNSGSAYVFVRSGTVWNLQQKIVPDAKHDGQHFGFSVSLVGDTVAIGSPEDYPSYSGAVYVFTRSGTNWGLQQKITPDNESGNFGFSVSLNSNTVVIGCDGVYVFTRSGTVWSLEQQITSTDGENNSDYNWFGESVSLHDNTAVIGAPGVQDSFGSAYIFTRTGISWTEQQKISAYDAESSDYFGSFVSINGDTVAVSSRNDLGGLAYIYRIRLNDIGQRIVPALQILLRP